MAKPTKKSKKNTPYFTDETSVSVEYVRDCITSARDILEAENLDQGSREAAEDRIVEVAKMIIQEDNR